jgi:hypothetical protein
MIWHIFKKDWKLLWRQSVAVVALATGATFADAHHGYFGAADPATSRAETAFGVLAFFAGLVLVTGLIQQDPIPGGAQDWLVRPVKRLDLLLAKILFIVLALQAPMLVVTVVIELAQGFPLGKSLSTAAMDTLTTTLSLGLPALAFASLFRGLTETVAATFACVLALFAGAFLLTGNANFPMRGPTAGTGVHWVVDASQSTIYFLGAIAVLAMQYFRRRTTGARWVAAAIFALASVTPMMMPWQPAFALQQRLAPQSGAAASVTFDFNSSARRNDPALAGLVFDGKQTLCIPLVLSGVPANAWVNIDGASASLIDATGTVVWTSYIQQHPGNSSALDNHIRGNLAGTANTGRCQPVPIDINEINRLADTPGLRARLDYSLTLFGPDKSYAMPASSPSDNDQILPGVGRCRTQVGDDVKLGCMTQKAPTCAMAFLEDKTTGTRTPQVYSCTPDYDPFRGGDAAPWDSGLTIPWRNVPHQVINNWQLILQTYKPLDHFTRRVTTPEIKLRDWLPRS